MRFRPRAALILPVIERKVYTLSSFGPYSIQIPIDLQLFHIFRSWFLHGDAATVLATRPYWHLYKPSTQHRNMIRDNPCCAIGIHWIKLRSILIKSLFQNVYQIALYFTCLGLFSWQLFSWKRIYNLCRDLVFLEMASYYGCGLSPISWVIVFAPKFQIWNILVF